MASFIKADSHLTLVFDDGESATVYNTNPNYSGVCEAVKNKDWGKAKNLAFPVEAVKQAIKGIENVAIDSGFVTYDGVPLHNTLSARMLTMHAEGFDISPLAIFLENLMDNPSHRAVGELYDFLEASDLPITEDGCFLAYKRVADDFKDIYTGTVDNSPGAFVEMRRNEVDEDKDRTCSQGLHFCSRSYLPMYGTSPSNKVVMIKINPRDVVAIPSDYNNAKGRCCAYTVVKELQLDFTTRGNLPMDNLEGAFRGMTPVSDTAVEQLNLAEALLGEGEPTVIALFDSATEAMHKVDIDSSSITKVCDGIRRSAGGYAWRWASDNPNNYIAEMDDEAICEDDWADPFEDDDFYED